MKRHRAFASDWFVRPFAAVFLIAVWQPVIARLTGWSLLISIGVLTFLAIALGILCDAIAGRDAQKAWVVGNVFLLIPALAWLILMVSFLFLMLWRANLKN